jgi:hypothetical protein
LQNLFAETNTVGTHEKTNSATKTGANAAEEKKSQVSAFKSAEIALPSLLFNNDGKKGIAIHEIKARASKRIAVIRTPINR